MKLDPFISIVIPTKNGERYLEDLLKMVAAQKIDHIFETIIIDSGSIDNTLSIAQKFKVRIVEIKPEEFGHGKTRNLGARISKGRYIVFISQDAIPLNEFWLENLVKNIVEERDIAAVYGRNIPRLNCDPPEARYISKAWRDIKEIKSMHAKNDLKKLIFFSNSNSCVDKKIWENFQFNENLIQTEDQEWSMRILREGYKIVYEPNSVVVHSHNDSFVTRFKRYYDTGIAHKQIFGDNNRVYLPLIPLFGIVVTLLDLRFMVERNYTPRTILKWAFIGIIFHFMEASGFWAGLHSKYFSKRLHMKMTLAGRNMQ